MAEVPEHLLRRAAERKAALEAEKAKAAGGEPAAEAPAAAPPAPAAAAAAETPAEPAVQPKDPSGKIPAHLLARSQAARAKASGEAGGDGGGEDGGGGGTPPAPAPPPATSGAAAAARVVSGAGAAAGAGLVGPAGHTQRLLTVVKAGSIQDVKATPTDKVHTWPHLLLPEFVASLAMTAFLLIFSAFVNAPLLATANFNLTPNPSKAPWYFLGLQELLTMFHPMVAGVTIPGLGLIGLGASGYLDKNPSNKPEDRKFAIALFTIFMMFWAVLVIIGSFFRGEGFNFIYPWRQGVHEIFDL